MQGCYRARIMLLIFILSLLLAGQAWAGDSARLCSGLAEPDGLVMDNRGNVYTICRGDGVVWCVPPEGEPVAFARVDAPTCLTVDRLRTVFVGTASGDIFAITPDGVADRIHRCRTGLTGLTLDRDGNLVAATADGMIVRIAREDFRWED
ncbi:hypothetical protein EDC59_102155 [Pseudodesulfovibrio indicus]|uniref:SMP-30/Gluconolactonase/LRE-like region domain-containing protein n=2 Tax=Pseudodesulfovibrio indicus TaxID=1716143 RepID=A0AA94TKX6_9BACT|nr:hypothetical protein EDC59_102155 [Pseudodesulfovibrio indicus]